MPFVFLLVCVCVLHRRHRFGRDPDGNRLVDIMETYLLRSDLQPGRPYFFVPGWPDTDQ